MRRRLLLLAAMLPMTGCLPLQDDRPVSAYPGGPRVYADGPNDLLIGGRTGYGAGWGSGGSSWGGGSNWGGRTYGGDPFQSPTYRPSRRVVCDSRTELCYKRGELDRSETQDQFGNRAGRRLERIRDEYGGNVVVPRRGVVCDRDDQVCYKGGRPDRSDTRDVFGKGPARRIPKS